MNSRLVKYMLSVGLAIGVVSACKDSFLSRDPQGQYSPTALKTPSGVEGLLIGAYAMIDGQGLDGQDP
jgi:hypothetical protein